MNDKKTHGCLAAIMVLFAVGGIFAISWAVTVGVIWFIVWLLIKGGAQIEFNIWIATATWLILLLLSAFFGKNRDKQ